MATERPLSDFYTDVMNYCPNELAPGQLPLREVDILDAFGAEYGIDLDTIGLIAKEAALVQGRENPVDDLLTVIRKFYMGSLDKKPGDIDEVKEMIDELALLKINVPLVDVLNILADLRKINAKVEGAHHDLGMHLDNLARAQDEQKIGEFRRDITSSNQLFATIMAARGESSKKLDAAEIPIDYRIEVAQEAADFVYMLAKVKNVDPSKVPSREKLEELLNACGGFTYEQALLCCYYKYGGRVIREMHGQNVLGEDHVPGSGKNKKRERRLLKDVLVAFNHDYLTFDPDKIKPLKVQEIMREILFDIIGPAERIVVVNDWLMTSKLTDMDLGNGKRGDMDVRLVIPIAKRFGEQETEGGPQPAVFSNFMTTARISDEALLKKVLISLNPGTSKSPKAVNGYEYDDKLRVKGFNLADRAQVIQDMVKFEMAIQSLPVINESVTLLSEMEELDLDGAIVGKKIAQLGTKNIMSWISYIPKIKRIVRKGLSSTVQIIPMSNHFGSKRKKGETISSHSVLFRGYIDVPEDVVKGLLADGSAELVTEETKHVDAPILVVDARRKVSILARLMHELDASKKETPYSVIVEGITVGNAHLPLAFSSTVYT